MQSTVLILGARGRFGLAAAKAFRSAGWRVVGLMRSSAAIAGNAAALDTASGGIEWLNIDLYNTHALAAASHGAQVVVHALNPSAYTLKAWRAEVQPMASAAINVARALNATLMMPGNVYNFGADMPRRLDEAAPQLAQTAMGRMRTALEAQLREVGANSGVKTVVIRAGNFFGSGAGSWFDLFIAKGTRQGRFTYPGPLHVPTAWAYLPDLARAFVDVAEKREQLAQFETLHFAGYSVTGQQWQDALTAIARAQGWLKTGQSLKRGRVPWVWIRALAWAVPMFASLQEMRYLWDTPHALVNGQLEALIGAEPTTPFAEAVSKSLSDLGWLHAARPASALVKV